MTLSGVHQVILNNYEQASVSSVGQQNKETHPFQIC